MGASDEAASGPGTAGCDIALDLSTALGAHRKEVSRLARIAKNLSRPWSDPKAVEKALEEISKCAGGLPPAVAPKARALAEEGSRWLEREREGRRQRLAKEIKEASAARGVRVLLITKDPLEIRLAPLGVRIDLEKARAWVVFGQVEIFQCAARGEEILKAREKALKRLERRKWSPRGFHAKLREAWGAAARKLARPDGWVELGEVVPELAFAIQGPRWRYDPTARNFADYGKAHFLYDLHRLREAGALSADGWRLVLGPATGSSTRDKRRVFWVEDGEGRGAYHLTLRFVREEGIHAEEK